MPRAGARLCRQQAPNYAQKAARLRGFCRVMLAAYRQIYRQQAPPCPLDAEQQPLSLPDETTSVMASASGAIRTRQQMANVRRRKYP
jgi:hypothetical protein